MSKVFIASDPHFSHTNMVIKYRGFDSVEEHDKVSHITKYTQLPNIIGISGITKYKGFWLSHAPIHPDELRGCKNIHGHVHENTLQDSRYINACLDVINYSPIKFNELIKQSYD